MSAPNREWSSVGEGDLLERARSLGLLSALDQQFATRLARLYDEPDDGIRWALAIACRQEAAGHVCADLLRLGREGLVTEVSGEMRVHSVLATHDSLEDWLAEIRENALVDSTGDTRDEAGAPRPLVLDERGRLFLRRAHRHQMELAERIRARATVDSLRVDWAWAESAIARLMPGSAADDDPARQALRTGLARPLSIVTGGPGTGKTTMVARLIALLIEEASESGGHVPRIRLLAPTGKAAAAMASAFARGRDLLEVSDEVRNALPSAAETIHRALHRQTRPDAFGRPGRIRLDAEIVVVDEASMVDLELMNRLFEACEGIPRVVLLGDPGQLASADSGAVLAELCDDPGLDRPMSVFSVPLAAAGPPSPENAAEGLADSIVTLQKSHRFSDSGGIGRLAGAIRAGDAEGVIRLFADPELPEIERCEVVSSDSLAARLIEESRGMHAEIEGVLDPKDKLDRMGLYRVLCAHRRGPLGVEALCTRLDEAAAAIRRTTPRAGWWRGRLLLVTRNAPDQDLWNGDVGLVEETETGLRALFADASGGVRALSAGRLPLHESAIAMSVHKSQGSEFDVVDLVLGDVASPLMTRELLYTGVTRARRTLRVHASESALREMLGRRIQRDSGLGERLWAD
ncbi:MAG: exodeoxyribonuclease V subunit alpha [bacterium]|nr:exodeoxyribonuclease V subunit alpha [bacterium]